MEPLNIEGLPANALVLVYTAPIIYVLEGHPQFAQRFRPLFEAHEAGALQLAVTTVTIAEVMTGLKQKQAAIADQAIVDQPEDYFRYSQLAIQYSEVFSSWRVIALNEHVAYRAAWLRAAYRFKLPDAVQAASALSINADALVTNDRDFSRLKSQLTEMRIIF